MMETIHNIVIKNGLVIDKSLNINGMYDVYISNGRVSSIRQSLGGGTGTHSQHNSLSDAPGGSGTHSHSQHNSLSDAPGGTGTHSQHNSLSDAPGGTVQHSILSDAPRGTEQHISFFDATGCIVTAGLVDCHVHAYEHVTPLGVNIDQACLTRGVTALVDAGSAGSSTFPGLRKFIAERSKAHLYSFLHIAQHGLASAGCVSAGTGGECDSLNVVNVEDCVRVIRENRDMIVGVKVRLAVAVTDNGKNEEEVYRRALQAADICQVPLMTHHAMSSIEHGGKLGCPGDLRKGDIYTHCFHNYNSILDPVTGNVDKHCLDAKKRGVLFDIGHGQGSFSWTVAEKCASQGFWPDIISTDLHNDSINGPAYDLPCVMTKMLHVGMSLEEIIAAVTSTPARAIGKLGEIGQLGIGMSADITVMKIEDVSESLEDSSGDERTVKKVFVPVAVFIGGQRYTVNAERKWPNPACVADCRARVARNKNRQ